MAVPSWESKEQEYMDMPDSTNSDKKDNFFDRFDDIYEELAMDFVTRSYIVIAIEAKISIMQICNLFT